MISFPTQKNVFGLLTILFYCQQNLLILLQKREKFYRLLKILFYLRADLLIKMTECIGIDMLNIKMLLMPLFVKIAGALKQANKRFYFKGVSLLQMLKYVQTIDQCNSIVYWNHVTAIAITYHTTQCSKSLHSLLAECDNIYYRNLARNAENFIVYCAYKKYFKKYITLPCIHRHLKT